MMPTDESLMLAVRNGEVDQFAVLFERHHDRLFAFFYRMTGDPPASEDLAQEVFVRMLKYRSGFGETSEFRAWMYQIARNVRADHFRKRMAEAELPEDARADEGRLASVHLERQEELSVLQKALLALSEDKREILILARFEEMKYEAIAAMLQIEVGAVKVRVHRALRELRAVYLRMSGEEPKCDVKKPKTILRTT
jgi:RNA polymerase sigma-70 factor (ECF subfamily)